MKKVLLLLIVSALVFALAACTTGTSELSEDNSYAFDFQAQQIEKDQAISITWTDSAISEIEVTVKHGEQTVTSQTFKGEELADKAVTVDAYYGKHTVSVKATSTDNLSGTASREVSLSNSEYVIAPISGSMPQLYFTLNLKEITDNYSIPAFVWLARSSSWNWDNLPENVYAMPTVDMSEILVHENIDRMIEVTEAYIKELYSIDSTSKFNLYINDYDTYLYLKLFVANGIPEDNFYVTLLSDGGASYKYFNEAFDSENPEFDADAKYSEMATKLSTLYTEVKEAGNYYWSDDFSVNVPEMRQYSYVAAREMDNVEWWILRPRAGVLCSPDEDFINRVLNDDKTEGIIEERNFASPLTNMTDEEKAELKALYNFNNEMFEEADESGKKAMMILGSWATAENEPDFEAYVRFVKAYYGDEFVYYYKGHPNTPTSNYPEKQEQLEELGLIDVESSINAELILFFYPDIYMCGYNSSTFLSVQSSEMACAIFNMKYEECTGDYKDLIGIFISKIDVNDFEYSALCENAEHAYFFLEYRNMGEDFEADFGIYDDTTGTIINCKIIDGKVTEIE